MSSLQGPSVKPRSSRRLLEWHCYVLLRGAKASEGFIFEIRIIKFSTHSAKISKTPKAYPIREVITQSGVESPKRGEPVLTL